MESSNKNNNDINHLTNSSNIPNHVTSSSIGSKKPISREGNKALEIERPFFETAEKVDFKVMKS